MVRNTLETIGWSRNLRVFTHSYNYVALVVPALVVGPMYMRGEIEFGVVTQAEMAFAQVLAAVSVIVSYFENLSASAASVQRIGDLCDAFDDAEAEGGADGRGSADRREPEPQAPEDQETDRRDPR